MSFAQLRTLVGGIILALSIGAVGGGLAKTLGAPMPFLIGSFLASAVATLSGVSLFGLAPKLPMPLRNVFVGIIGVMIGGSFHPGIFATLSQIWLPAIAVLVFVITALVANYLIFRHIGGYDRATAFFSAMPGGLIEAIAMGEKAGADPHILALQQISRISLVITTLPFLFFIWKGEKVGSAAGASLINSQDVLMISDWIILAICVVAGMLAGRALRLPANILIGPMILSAAVHYFGITQAGPPVWLIALSQIFVGTGLGARFRGFRAGEFFKVIGLAVVSVALMLSLDAGIVVLLRLMIDTPFDVLLISFAPGGVTETALIALSLHANPVYVTTLHVLRIVVTVVLGGVVFKIVERT